MSEYDHAFFISQVIPERHVNKVYLDGTPCKDHHCDQEINSDNKMCYKATCYATTAHLSKMLDLSEDKFTTTFQSRLGRDPWLEPYTDQTVEQLAKGVKKMLVFSPAFVADYLKPLEFKKKTEIFIENGGEKLDLVPALNDSEDWAKCVVDNPRLC